jgi:hypothetical protein
MAVLNTGLAKVSGGYTIDQSLRFNDDDSAYLSRTPSSAGDQKTWTFSCWFKYGNIEDDNYSFFQANSNSTFIQLRRTGLSNRESALSIAGSSGLTLDTSASLRDPSAWYNIIVVLDTTQSTSSNRCKVYLNGTQITDFYTENYPTQNADLDINNNVQHNIGYDTADYLDGYLAEVHFIDGQALTPADFGETDEDYGHWKPTKYTGTYGTNGFYLDFSDSAALGDDAAGSNDWTVNNLTASDQVLDSPTNNFATFNPLEAPYSSIGSHTYSEGNLQVVTPNSGSGNTFSTIGVTSGKWYAEFYIKAYTSLPRWLVGVTGDLDATFQAGTNVGSLSGARDVGYMGNDGDKYVSGSESSYGSAFSNGDIIGVVLDVDNDTVNFYHNNVAKGTISISSTGTWHIGVGDVSGGGGGTIVANFGQDSSFAGNKTAQGNQDSNDIGDFYYTPPTDFLALCTSNLPDPAVIPSEHFNTVLYTGNASTQSITGVGFQPDFVWIKNRENATKNHNLYDTVRGAGYYLKSDTTSIENYSLSTFSSFDSDGFSIGNTSTLNESSVSHVSWNWNCPTTFTPTVTSGLTSASGRSNADAGFSIVKVTGDSNISNDSSYTHNLGVAPEMIIQRRLDSTDHWNCYHKDLGGAGKFIELDSATAIQDAANVYETTPTSTVVKPCTNIVVNGATHIFYNFASVDGYSKVGSYTGNNSTDGTFVYTGFRPAYVMQKHSTSAEDWNIFDNERGVSYNLVDDYLRANDSGAEVSNHSTVRMDLVSNGFKIRGTNSGINTDGATFIYLAFAEQPFKHSNAR